MRCSFFLRFMKNRGGNFAMTSALLAPLLIGVAGLAIDVTNVMQKKSDLQAIADAATLAAATNLAKTENMTTAQAEEMANQYLFGQYLQEMQQNGASEEEISKAKTEFKKNTSTGAAISPTGASGKNYTVRIDTALVVPMSGLSQILGFKEMPLRISSVAHSASQGHALSMYLVLDRSGSMADDTTTINSAKPTKTIQVTVPGEAVAAASQPATEPAAASQPEQCRGPRCKNRNSGPGSKNQGNSCRGPRCKNSDNNSAQASNSNNSSNSSQQQTQAPSRVVSQEVPNYVTKIEALKTAASTMFSELLKAAAPHASSQAYQEETAKKLIRIGAVSYAHDTQPEQPPEWGTTKASDYVKALPAVPTGGTDATGALDIAIAALKSSKETSEHAAKNNLNFSRFIVLMSDGEMTGNSWQWNEGIDRKVRAQCKTAKETGITVFTVAFMAPDRGKSLLKACASDASNYYEASGMSELVKAFGDIGRKAAKAQTRLTN